MELHLKKETVAKILENHYKEQEDFDGKVTFDHYIGPAGYGPQEHKDVIVTTQITGKIKLLGEEATITRPINFSEITSIITAVLEAEGYEADTVKLDAGLTTEWTGSGMYEQQVEKSYFNGLVSTVKKNMKIKQKGR